jgi:hypothetical protein
LISQFLTLYSTPVVYLLIDDRSCLLRKRRSLHSSESAATSQGTGLL